MYYNIHTYELHYYYRTMGSKNEQVRPGYHAHI